MEHRKLSTLPLKSLSLEKFPIEHEFMLDIKPDLCANSLTHKIIQKKIFGMTYSVHFYLNCGNINSMCNNEIIFFLDHNGLHFKNEFNYPNIGQLIIAVTKETNHFIIKLQWNVLPLVLNILGQMKLAPFCTIDQHIDETISLFDFKPKTQFDSHTADIWKFDIPASCVLQDQYPINYPPNNLCLIVFSAFYKNNLPLLQHTLLNLFNILFFDQTEQLMLLRKNFPMLTILDFILFCKNEYKNKSCCFIV